MCLEVGGEGLDSDLCLQAGAGLSCLSEGAVPGAGWGAATVRAREFPGVGVGRLPAQERVSASAAGIM